MQNNDITYEVLGSNFGGKIQVERCLDYNCQKNGASFWRGGRGCTSLWEDALLY